MLEDGSIVSDLFISYNGDDDMNGDSEIKLPSSGLFVPYIVNDDEKDVREYDLY